MFFEKRVTHRHLQTVHAAMGSSLAELEQRMEEHHDSVLSWLHKVYGALRQQEAKNRRFEEDLRSEKALLRKNTDSILELQRALRERESQEDSLRRVHELVTALTHRILNIEKSVASLPRKDENVEVLLDSVSLLRSRVDRIQREVEESASRAMRVIDQKVSVLAQNASKPLEEWGDSLSASLRSEIDALKAQLVDPLRVRAIEERLESLKTEVKPLPVPQTALPQVQSSFLREKLLKKLSRKSKDYIKTVLLSLIAKYGRISGLELREIIVEEQSLCSKSSFYRLLEELERESDIGVIVEGKEKIFLAKRSKVSED